MQLIEISPSTKKDKKYMAIFLIAGHRKTVHFGAYGYKDFTIYFKEDPKLAEQKKRAYIARHSVREDFENPITPGALSYWILWNLPTVEESIEDYKHHFGFE